MDSRENIVALAQELTSGRLNRRDFIKRATVLGLSASAIAAVLAACGASATATPPPAPTATKAAAASAAPAASAAGAGAASAAPSAAASAAASAKPSAAASAAASAAPSAAASAAASAAPAAKAGGGGPLKLLWWQAPTILNPHLSQGTKDYDASRVVYEPLATIGIDGKFVPVLASEIPTKENGAVAADGTSVTWKLKKGVKWHDGQDFTANDVVFTWQFVADTATAATTIATYKSIKSVDAVDDSTVKITFSAPTAGWFEPFTGSLGMVLPEHVFKDGKGAPAKNFPANLKPVGTGPYKISNFAPGDTVEYAINTAYHMAGKPFFDTVTIKGGGDAPSAARAVLQTGDYDYAWNLQVEDTILKQLETGGKGVVLAYDGASTERLLVNFTDPNKETDGERSSLKNPHPFQTDKAVRNALALACDKKTMVDTLYGRAGAIGDNLLYNPPQYNSKNNPSVFDLAKANALLDGAGYAKSGQYRAKNGVQLKVVYQTTVNALRQKEQQVIKDAWEKLGVQTELKSIDAGVYFSSDAGNPDTAAHFYADIEMYTNGNSSPEPFAYMEGLTTSEIAQKSNQWSGANATRWSNKDYDAVIEQLKTELDPAKRTELFIKANDIEVQDFAEIPLVARKSVSGKVKTLAGNNPTTWDSELWDLRDWKRG